MDGRASSCKLAQTVPACLLRGRYSRIWKERREPLPLETSVPGVFAVGDLRAGAMNRVASAVGEGSMAVRLTHEYLALT
jgi:thioredoxin reductase (NADPH)